MKCSDVEKHISLYIDNDLPDVMRREMEEHLADCENCRRVYRETRAVRTLLQERPAVKAPETFARDVNRMIDKEQERSFSRRIVQGINNFLSLRHVLEAAGAAAVALIVIVLINPAADLRRDLTDVKSENETVPAFRMKKEAPAERKGPGAKQAKNELKNAAKDGSPVDITEKSLKKAPSLREQPVPAAEKEKEHPVGESEIILRVIPIRDRNAVGSREKPAVAKKKRRTPAPKKMKSFASKSRSFVKKEAYRSEGSAAEESVAAEDKLPPRETPRRDTLLKKIIEAAKSEEIEIISVRGSVLFLRIKENEDTKYFRFLKKLENSGGIKIEKMKEEKPVRKSGRRIKIMIP